MLTSCRWWLGSMVGAGALLSATSALSQPLAPLPALSASDREALLAGDRVERPLRFATRRGSYVGGLSYQLVRARPEEVLTALQDVRQLPELLPRTKAARWVGVSEGRARIELTQGNGLLAARYTLQLERSVGRDELRFWLDRRAPSDIRDVWGYFRVEEHVRGRSLLTVAVALDLGPGLARALFEDKVQGVLLGSVTKIRDFMEPSRVAEVGY